MFFIFVKCFSENNDQTNQNKWRGAMLQSVNLTPGQVHTLKPRPENRPWTAQWNRTVEFRTAEAPL